ncbi:MAG: WD40/YVTN/BNR-like repeat-containing protein [Polyangiaceae bacterium]
MGSSRLFATLVLPALALPACSSSSSPAPGDGGSPPSRWAAAVGAHGTFTQTFDEVSWASRSLGSVDWRAVACVGNLDGWTAGSGGAVAHTTDGGATWTAQQAGTTATLRAVRFASSTSGVFVGDGGTVGYTRDAGATWTLVAPLTTATLRAAAVAPSTGLTFVAGDSGTVLRSTDGGATWSTATVAGAGSFTGIASDAAGTKVVAADSLGSIWSSNDQGAHFVVTATAPGPLQAISLSDDGNLGIAVGDRGVLMVDPGTGSWTAARSGTTSDLHAVVVMDSANDRIYAAGETGALLSSADRGVTWSAQPSNTTAALYALDDL